MIRASIAFFVIALLAIIFGATGLAGVSMEIGKTLLLVFLVLSAVSLVISLVSGRKAKDLMAWVAFCQERNVEPIAVEIPLVSRTHKVAGTCDLVCRLDFNGKRELAIVDIKSGGSYEDHAVQLDMYRIAFNEQGLFRHYPELDLP